MHTALLHSNLKYGVSNRDCPKASAQFQVMREIQKIYFSPRHLNLRCSALTRERPEKLVSEIIHDKKCDVNCYYNCFKTEIFL